MKAYMILAALIAATSLRANTFTSTDNRTDLIELFTSEGCSSCPPAEKKMNGFAKHDGLWRDFVPVAFHVDYWNYLGWPDRFSKSEFTARQRQYSKQWKGMRIYTPCFVINGAATRRPKPESTTDRRGILQATVTGGEARITFKPADPGKQKLKAWIVPLSGEITSKVTSGENRGRTLTHRFVALGLESEAMQLDGGTYAATLSFNRPAEMKAVAVWVSDSKTLTPIQATGGWIDK